MSHSASDAADLSPGGHRVGPATKADLRRLILSKRRERGEAEVAAAAGAFADSVLQVVAAHPCATVAAYLSTGSEPPTHLLLTRLHAAGLRVLAPVLLADGDLDWARWSGAEVVGRRGLREPAGPRLGPGAIRAAGVLVVPALAVGRDGTRLGRGGGSYDRALVRANPAAVALALLWEDELRDAVPAQPHDRGVQMVLTPSTAYDLSPPASPPAPAGA